MSSTDGKVYSTDCLGEEGVNLLLLILPLKNKNVIQEWMNGKK